MSRRSPRVPPPVTIGNGENPSILVDGAGTAHIVWNEPVPGRADRPHYCRIPRGASACAVSKVLTIDQPASLGNSPDTNKDTEGPRALSVGNELLVLSNRSPNVVAEPGCNDPDPSDCPVSDTNNYLFTSGEGGSSFGDPGLIDTNPVGFGAVAFGAGSPFIATLASEAGQGLTFQAAHAGQFASDTASFGEFRRRHEVEIAELFDDALGLCREAGLVSVGVITIDGTKLKANASMDQNRSYRGLVTEILRKAEETDRREDELYGDSRADELPEALRTPEGRRQALADAKRRIQERKSRGVDDEPVAEMNVDLESTVLARPVLRRGGRREWFGVARRELDAHRARQARPVPRDRDHRRFQAVARLEENHRVGLAANEAYERCATKRDTRGRVLRGNSKPFVAPEVPEGQINLSDPDSRVMRTQGMPPRQAYNAQAAVNDQQIILAAEITIDAPDFGHLEPMLDRTLKRLERHGVSQPPGAVIADAGYWHTAQIQAITGRGIDVLVPPDGAMREGKRPGWEHGVYDEMRDKLATERGRRLYALRKITIEPVYGQIKHNHAITAFMRRGRAAVRSE